MTSIDPRDHSRHDLDDLSEALDGRLSPERQADVLERMRECSACRAAYDAMAWSRTQARRLPAEAGPEGLEAGVRARLLEEDEGATRASRRWLRRFAALAAAVALALGLASLLNRAPFRSPSLPAAVASDYRQLVDGRLELALVTGEAARLEAWFAGARLGFPVRVFDLGMMGLTLRGGVVRDVPSGRGALFVYREVATGRDILCEMLRAKPAELPPGAQPREHDGIPFHLYRVDDVTLVFWPEGDVLCVLAGGGDPEALLQLAFAKAMKGRPAAT